jgi:hypothetical protein
MQAGTIDENEENRTKNLPKKGQICTWARDFKR